MKQETFINFRSYLWFWIVATILASLCIWYYIDDPIGGRNGTTVFGYSSGSLATLAILYLMWFGVRKRSYYAYRVSLKGWLSAHVWIGLALVIIVPLHAAFYFGMNFHTLAYALLCLVVASGIVGSIYYQYLPSQTISNRGGGALKKRFEDYNAINQEIKLMLNKYPRPFKDFAESLEVKFEPTLMRALFSKKIAIFDSRLAADKLATFIDAERTPALDLVALLSKERELAISLRKEILVRAKLKAWLFIHIPISMALCLLVALHIFSVFYYR